MMAEAKETHAWSGQFAAEAGFASFPLHLSLFLTLVSPGKRRRRTKRDNGHSR